MSRPVLCYCGCGRYVPDDASDNPAAPTAEPQSPVDEMVRSSAEAGLYGDVAATAEAEAYAQAATLARVEALATHWETSDVRLSRRIAANELRRAMEGGS